MTKEIPGILCLIIFSNLAWVVFVLNACAPREQAQNAVPGEQVTIEAGEASGHAAGDGQTVTLSPQAQQLIGLEVAEVSARPMSEAIPLTGEIGRDTEKFHHVAAQGSGEVLSLLTRTGDIVKSGQALALIRSWGNSTSAVSAPMDGMIIGEHVSAGSRVDSVTPIYTIADLSVMWANFDVHEKDISKIKKGQEIKVRSSAYPDRDFTGGIVFISPEVDEITRTIKIRAQIKNPEYLLKFNMFVTGTVLVPQAAAFLVVPQAAVQEIKENRIVFVPGENGKMAAREVKTGLKNAGYVQIIAGLKSGEKVVTQGSFALKSELLKATFGGD
jgi:cobalt-zinc-cadmium efflux system membrane fusion protein